jgi:predicted TIM-barrel fold metal-dependent hydrolase
VRTLQESSVSPRTLEGEEEDLIIDVNTYMGFWPYWKLKSTNSDALVETARQIGVDRLVITSNRGIFYDCDEGNEETAEAVRQHPKELMGFATISPLFRDTESIKAGLENLIDQQGLIGLKLFPVYHSYRLKDRLMEPIFEEAARLRLPVLVPVRLSMNWSYKNFFGRPSLQDVGEIVALADRFSELKVIVGCVNYTELTDLITAAKRFDNIFVETSGLQSGFEFLVDSIGAEKVLLGTGMPIQYPSVGLTKVLQAEVSQDAKELILGRNAEKLLPVNKPET